MNNASNIIYIIGSGRSGTTLLDILLGNGNNIFSAGELNRFTKRNGIPHDARDDEVLQASARRAHQDDESADQEEQLDAVAAVLGRRFEQWIGHAGTVRDIPAKRIVEEDDRQCRQKAQQIDFIRTRFVHVVDPCGCASAADHDEVFDSRVK